MKKELSKNINPVSTLLRNKLQRGFSRRETVGISVILHLSLGIIFASIQLNKTDGIPILPEDTAIEFELITEDQLNFSSSMSNSDKALDGPNQQSTEAIPKLGEQIGLESSDSDVLVAEKIPVTKEAVMMASLADLKQLRESFNFMLSQVSADSSGAFVPLGGQAPFGYQWKDNKLVPIIGG